MLSNRDASQMITPHNWGIASGSQSKTYRTRVGCLTPRSVFLRSKSQTILELAYQEYILHPLKEFLQELFQWCS